MKRIIPKGSSKAKTIALINSQAKFQIEYQPRYFRIFMNENLGIPMNQYVDFYVDIIRLDQKIKKFIHIIYPGDLDFGRRLCPHEKHKEQLEFREQEKAILSVDLKEFNNYININKLVGKNDKENQTYKFDAYITLYIERLGKEILTKTRSGIAIDITQYYQNYKRKNPIITNQTN